jgi:hypothetical protein
VVKNRLPPDKASKIEAVTHGRACGLEKTALVTVDDRLDSGVLDLELDHPGGGAGNTRTIVGSVDLSFDHFELIGNQKVKDLLLISREICGLVGGTPDWISFDMFLEHLSSAEDEFGVQALLGPLEKVLENISGDKLQENVVKLKQLGLDGMIALHLESRKQQRIDEGGMSVGMLRSFFNGFPELDHMIELFEHGARWLHKEDFECNGLVGKGLFSKSYLDNIDVCNHTVADGIAKGQILAVPLLALSEDEVRQLHSQPYKLASKFDVKGKPTDTGRLCLHGSYGGSKSRNASMDRKLLDKTYKPEVLTNASELSEVACNVRDRYPAEKVYGTMIDVTNAYGQNLQSVATAKTCCSLVKTVVDDVEIVVVCIYMEMVFGGTESGAAYALLGRAIDWAHNRTYKQSSRYVDDHSLINAASRINQSESLCVRIITALFGRYGVNPKKLIRYEEDLISIGWQFNLRRDVWTVKPKPKGIRKLFAAVFVHIKIGQNVVKAKMMEEVVGVLNHYLRVIPLAETSIKSLYACMDYSGYYRDCVLSDAAQDDLTWLRAVVLICMSQPELVSISIDHLRSHPVVEAYIKTDAATSVGGGGALGDHPDEGSLTLCQERIRWSELEFAIFNSQGVSINVLELFAGVYHVLLWGDRLRGKVVKLFIDNTSAVSWLNSRRGNIKSVGGIALLRVLSVYCMIMKIRVICEHIPGVDNVLADTLSRDSYIVLQDGKQDIIEDKDWLKGLSKKECCRKLLKIAIVEPERLHLRGLLEVVQHLLTTRG